MGPFHQFNPDHAYEHGDHINQRFGMAHVQPCWCRPAAKTRQAPARAEQRAKTIHLRDGISEADFVASGMARYATLEVPSLMRPSIQVNVRGGQLPPADDKGIYYLRIPLNALPLRAGALARNPARRSAPAQQVDVFLALGLLIHQLVTGLFGKRLEVPH